MVPTLDLNAFNLLSLLFSLTGVLLTSQAFRFLRPTDHMPEDVIFWVIDGGDAFTDPGESNREKDVAMIHGIWTTRWGAIFVLISIVIQQFPLSGDIAWILNIKVSGRVMFYLRYIGIFLGVFLFSCLLAFLVSSHVKKKAEKKHEEKVKKSESD